MQICSHWRDSLFSGEYEALTAWHHKNWLAEQARNVLTERHAKAGLSE
jgi:hypothetical protein